MPAITARSAVGLAGLTALIVYVGALQHEWAFDDGPIVQSNPAAHDPAVAWEAFFSPYWPGDRTTSGQYRPITILSFAVDWNLSNGSPTWLHAVNVLLHGLVTALFTAVSLAWLSPLGAVVAGTVFAVHPVHVEAVANVVGRGELLAAVGILGCILCARRYRRGVRGITRSLWLTTTGVLLIVALLAKEHAVVTVAAVALDEYLDRRGNFARSALLYLMLIALTGAWLYLWHEIAGQFVAVSEAATIRGLTMYQRLATMFPAQMEIVRLLVFPLDLAADYNPQLIARRIEWSLVATLGLTVTVAALALGVVSARRAPAVCFGILFAALTYAPTSNLVFASGIVLAERNLYLAVAAPALIGGWIAVQALTSWRSRGTQLVALRPSLAALLLGLVASFYVARTVTRIPFWRDGDDVLVTDYVEHPENYRARLRMGGYLRSIGDLPGALAEATAAGSIFPEDPWVAQYSVVRALDLGFPEIALREAQRAYAIDPTHPSFARFVVRALLAQRRFDAAVAVARRSVADAPSSPIAAVSYVEVLDSLGAPAWQRMFAAARRHWVERRLGSATAALDSAFTMMPHRMLDESGCWEVRHSLSIMRALRPEYLDGLDEVLARTDRSCTAGLVGEKVNHDSA